MLSSIDSCRGPQSEQQTRRSSANRLVEGAACLCNLSLLEKVSQPFLVLRGWRGQRTIDVRDQFVDGAIAVAQVIRDNLTVSADHEQMRNL